jgi:hypothetical protein
MHGIHDVFPQDAVDSNDPISERKLKNGEGMYKTRKTLLGLTLMARLKPCGLNRENARSYSPSSKGGYVQGSKVSWGSLLANLNPPLQRYGMHSRASWQEGGYSCLATNYQNSARPTFTYSKTHPSSWRWKGVGPSSENQTTNQPDAGNWCWAGQTTLE